MVVNNGRKRATQESAQLSIGALSSATGINVETIRSWERRYGYPQSERKPSGHRVYPLATVARLRRVAHAISRGHRTADVIGASERDLEMLLSALPDAGAKLQASLRPQRHAGSSHTHDLLAAVRAFDADTLKRSFQHDWIAHGPLDFLELRAAPVLAEIGNAWETGELEVRHEHFVSTVLGDFLRLVRTPLEDRATGPVVALATMPGELHGIGLQMAAVVFAINGWRSVMLGVDTPVKQIAALALEAPLAAVAVSVVGARKVNTQSRAITALRNAMPAEVPLLLGGSAGQRVRRAKGVLPLADLYALDEWIARER